MVYNCDKIQDGGDMNGKVDEIDKKILSELRDNCKIPIKELSKMLKIHPNTLLLRIRKLENEKVIKKYQAEVSYSKIGHEIQVVVMIKVKKGRAGDADQIKDISNLPQVESLYAVTGTYDVVAKVIVKDRNELLKVLQQIHENEIVTKTNTHMILYTYKYPSEFNPLKDGESSLKKKK